MKRSLLLIVPVAALLAAGLAAGQGIITTIAGGPPAPLVNGASALNVPFGLMLGGAVDSAGNLYVADASRSQVVRISTGGIMTIVAGNGTAGYGGDGGLAVNAMLNGPQGLALDAANNLYIADSANHRVRRVDGNGIITTVAGNGALSPDVDSVAATSSAVQYPTRLLIDPSGTLFIAEPNGHRVRSVSTSGIISTFAGNGFAGNPSQGDGGPATSAPIGVVESLARDSSGNFYLGTANQVRKVNPNGIISTIAGNGSTGDSGDGNSALSATLNIVYGIAVDSSGNLYLTLANSSGVRVIINGTIYLFGYTVGDSGPSTLNFPMNCFIDASNQLYIADTGNFLLRKVSLSGGGNVMTTVAGNGQFLSAGDGGPAVKARLNVPQGVAVDPAGNVYIADTQNNKIRKITTDGNIHTLAGNGAASGVFSPVEVATAAAVNSPVTVAVDNTSGDLYSVSYELFRVNPAGMLDEAIPAGGAWVAVDPSGNVYVAATFQNQVLKLGPSLTFTVVAGTGQQGFSGDGGRATAATMSNPTGLAFDSAGNMYIAEYASQRIRKVSPTGIITTYAGSGTCGFSGDGGLATSAKLCGPSGLAIDRHGNLYIADQNNGRIRMVTPAGVITTVAGGSSGPALGDGGLATSAFLNQPSTVAVDLKGNLYICDLGNGLIRMVSPLSTGTGALGVTPVTAIAGQTLHIPVTFSVASGSSADGVNFGLQVTPTGGSPALTGSLTFQPDASFVAPTLIDTSQGAGVISLAWLNLPSALQGSTHLGDVLLNVPVSASAGNSYSVRILAASASSGTTEVPLGALSSASFDVQTTYLVGDVDPANGTSFGSFGNEVLNTLDLIAILRAIAIGPKPAACTDLFDAMDAAPAIPDGTLNTLDLIAVLKRVTNLDTSRPRRSPRGIPCSAATPDGAEAMLDNARNRRTAPPDAEVEIGAPVTQSDGSTQSPLYLRALHDFWMEAFTVAVSGTGAMVLLPGDLGSPAFSDNGLPGTIAAMWDVTREAHAGDRILLGTVATSGSTRLTVLRAIGNAIDDSDLRIVVR